jgi:MFS family permease
MENLSKSLLGADDLMKVSWKSFRGRFLKFVFIFLLTLVAFLFIATILLTLALVSQSGAAVFVSFFLICVAFPVIVLVRNVMFFEVIKNKDIGIRQAFRQSIPKLISYVNSLLLYFVIALNLLVLSVFLGSFVLVSAVFLNLFPAAQSVSAILSIIFSFMIFSMGIVLAALFAFACVWKYFLFFDVLTKNMPVREAINHSFSLANGNIRAILERAGIFFLCCVLALVNLMMLSVFHPVFSVIAQAACFVAEGLGVMFLYAMYENLEKAGQSKTNAADARTVSYLIKSGSIILLAAILSVLFACMLSMGYMQNI